MGGGFSLIQTSFAAASADQDHGEEKKTVVVKITFSLSVYDSNI